MKYFFSAGEASGDLHAAQVIKELLKLDPEADIWFSSAATAWLMPLAALH